MFIVGIINVIGVIILLYCLGYLTTRRIQFLPGQPRLILTVLLGVLLVNSISNSLEHFGITSSLDPLEDYLGVLTPLLWAFFIYSLYENSIINELQTTRDIYRTIFENTGTAIAILDPDTTISIANQQFCRLVGVSCSDLEHKLSWTKFVDSKDLERMLKNNKRRQEDDPEAPHQYEFSLINTRGQKREILLTATLIPNSRKTLAALADITELKKSEQHRIQMEREVQYAQKLESLGVMAAGIAHDFNNLLMAIQGNADLILNNQTDENTKQSAGEIINASERASEICRQMLAYSGDESLYAESIDINEKIRQISKMLEMSVSKKAEVRYDFDQSLPPLAADIMQLRQIILNLVLNASEAIESENGEIVVSTGKRYCQSEDLRTIYIQDKLPSGEYVSIQVSDTGVGMDRDNLKRIFDPFYTSKFPGRGLGMPTVLGLIRGHRGSIDIESTPGEGTAVTVFLPAFHAPEEEEAKLEPGKTEENDSEDSSGRQVLMVDDERGILIVAEKMLTNLGYKVITASNGNEALQQFENNPETDCAILDLTMPQMGGKTAAAKLREIDPNLPILISSGYSEKDLHDKFAGMNINGYIQKPYNRKQLDSTLRNIFNE